MCKVTLAVYDDPDITEDLDQLCVEEVDGEGDVLVVAVGQVVDRMRLEKLFSSKKSVRVWGVDMERYQCSGHIALLTLLASSFGGEK